jgi:mono/diheme cytochrome c family protein
MLRWLAIGLMLASCESGPRSLPEGPAAPEAAHSRDQIVAATDLQLAVTQGRLIDARDSAQLLATNMPADVQRSAQRISQADDLAAAGLELGRLAGACGSCHAAAGFVADVPTTTAPPETKTLVGQMARHAWGAARLWEGVTGPAEQAWLDGALVIAETPMAISTVMRDKPNAFAFELAERLHDEALRARGATDFDARANLYGEMMATCASCHRILRPQPIVNTGRDAIATRSR